MPKTAIKQPDEQTFENQVTTIVKPFQPNETGIVVYPEITTQEAYVLATDRARTAKSLMAEVDEAYDSLIADANRLHKNLIAKKKVYWQPFKNLFDAIERRLSQYRNAEELKRQERERLLREEAQRQEQERLLHEAAMLEKTGNPVEAAIVMEEAVRTPPPLVVAPSTVPHVSGVFGRKGQWQFRIKDQSKIKPEYFCPDLDAIGAVVKAKGPLAVKMIGDGSIEVYQESSTVIRG